MTDSTLQKLAYVGAVCTLALLSSVAQGQGVWFSYAAKFTCGDRPNDNFGVVTGRYVTTINIHNRHYQPDQGIFFCKKVSYGRPQRNPLLEPSPRVPERLPPDFTLAVDCGDITALQPPPFVFSEGYLVIEVPSVDPAGQQQDPRGLDVTAVYTAKPRPGQQGSAPEVKALHIEQYEPREVLGRPFPPDECLDLFNAANSQ